jgi:hypothetical protein
VGGRAFQNGSGSITSLRVKLTSDTGKFNNATPSAGGGFQWFTNTSSGNFTTFGNAVPASALDRITSANPGGGGSSVTLEVNSTGSGPLGVGYVASSPAASNTAGGIFGFYSTTALWSQWDARFALLWNGTNTSGREAAAYLENEYGAAPYYSNSEWSILLLPVRPLNS